MKQILKISFGLMLTLLFISCKKDKPKEITTQEKVLGKWNISKNYYIEHLNTDPKNYLIFYQSGDYYDFRSDNKLYTRELGRNDTTGYIIDGTKITFTKELFHAFSANVSDAASGGIQLYFISNDGIDYNSNTIYLMK